MGPGDNAQSISRHLKPKKTRLQTEMVHPPATNPTTAEIPDQKGTL
jgi:hypothetical protein